jgi:outer membrane protein TolC
MRIRLSYILLSTAIICSNAVFAQTGKEASLKEATLEACVQYALTHQPILQQSLLDEAIIEKQIQGKLADWYPQLNLNYNLLHSFELPVSYFSGGYVRNGTFNTSNIGLNVTQNIFNRDVLFASRTAEDIRRQSKQNTSFNKIDLAVTVSKAFYDVLLTRQQVSVLNEAVVRLERSLKDAVSQYQSGVADKTDYKRATIALNNAKAQRKQTQDLIVAKLSYLKQLMGVSDSTAIQLQYDTSHMETDAVVDTTIGVKYENRIEYKLLQTQQRLQQASEKYYRSAYVPSISAFGNYNMSYLSNEFTKTYNNGFGNSNIGVQLAFPIFQGNKRVYQIRQAELQTKGVDWEMISLKNKLNTQYDQALAVYKGNLVNYQSLKENVVLADDVYKTLDIQYRSGIKTYLDVIIAESDLRTAQLNFYNALFQLLQSKLDVQKALGTIQY